MLTPNFFIMFPRDVFWAQKMTYYHVYALGYRDEEQKRQMGFLENKFRVPLVKLIDRLLKIFM